MARDEHGGGPRETTALRGLDRRESVVQHGAPFDFDESDRAAATCDDVDLAALDEITPRQDAPSLEAEVKGGRAFGAPWPAR